MRNTLIAALFGVAAVLIAEKAWLIGILGFLVVFQSLTLLDLQKHYARILMLLQIEKRLGAGVDVKDLDAR